MYKILIKSRTSRAYAYYTQKIGTEEVEYETEYLPELAKMYKALLKDYTTEQVILVHELEPELVVNIEDELSPKKPSLDISGSDSFEVPEA